MKLNDTHKEMNTIELEMLHISSGRKWWNSLLQYLQNDTLFISHLESVVENGELAYTR